MPHTTTLRCHAHDYTFDGLRHVHFKACALAHRNLWRAITPNSLFRCWNSNDVEEDWANKQCVLSMRCPNYMKLDLYSSMIGFNIKKSRLFLFLKNSTQSHVFNHNPFNCGLTKKNKRFEPWHNTATYMYIQASGHALVSPPLSRQMTILRAPLLPWQHSRVLRNCAHPKLRIWQHVTLRTWQRMT